MADRKQFMGDIKADPELKEMLNSSKDRVVTEDEIREQRISFAFGNAPTEATNITKESVKHASENLRLR